MMSNKEDNHYRPHFCAIQDKSDENIYWMIPISSKVEKFTKIRNAKLSKNKNCYTIIIGRYAGKDNAFLIQNAFPITQEYIDHIHTINNIPIKISTKLEKELIYNLNKTIRLYEQGHNLFFTNIEKIKQVLSK